MKKNIVIIGGIDSSNGAGITIDRKTLSNGSYNIYNIVTSITAQNSYEFMGETLCDIDVLIKQAKSIYNEILEQNSKLDLIKIGYFPFKYEILDNILQVFHEIMNKSDIIIDPILETSTGNKVAINKTYLDLINTITNNRIVLTPNFYEFLTIFGEKSATILIEEIAENSINKSYSNNKIFGFKQNIYIVVKSVPIFEKYTDVLISFNKIEWITPISHNYKTIHGTGCRYSSYFSMMVLEGINLYDCLKYTKKYLTEILIKQNNLQNNEKRFERLTGIPNISHKKIEQCSNLKIAIIGCGGIGSNIATHLARNGFKNFLLIDYDSVELSNLHRQNCYNYDILGFNKAIYLKNHLLKIDNNLNIEIISSNLFKNIGLLENYHPDIVIDGLDNLYNKMKLSEICYKNNFHLIHMGISNYKYQYCCIKNGKIDISNFLINTKEQNILNGVYTPTLLELINNCFDEILNFGLHGEFKNSNILFFKDFENKYYKKFNLEKIYD